MTALLLIVIGKALTEVALLMLLGRSVLGLVLRLLPRADPGGRQPNPVYRLFDLGARPPLRAARLLLPRMVPERHLPLAAAALLLLLWCALLAGKWQACQAAPGADGCPATAVRPR
jgi:hypothetical protein